MPSTQAVRRLLVLLTASLALPWALQAQRLPRLPERGGCRSEMEARLAFGLCPDSTFDFYGTREYRAGVPRPEAVLRYPIGSWHTTYGRMERYLEALARSAPERVRVFDYGETEEKQVMHLVAISSEANLARLAEIQANVQRLADPATSAADAEAIIARTPVVVWLNAANDGSETAAFEAAIQLAYQLAAGDDARTRAMRDGAVVLINLAHNPESHQRFVHWYNAFVAGDPNEQAFEHSPPWGMGNDNNHYQLDLNRDALAQTQTETRAVAYELQRWRPQVFADLHGETTQYFFPPAADPVSPVYPAQVERWLEVFGRGNAAAFDQLGWSYYTRDVFDLFYPGYWDTYPSLHGATGMTYETDGGGSLGVRWRRDDGTILTFLQGIAGHFVTSLATVETAVRNREARLRDYHRFFASAPRDAVVDGVRSVVLLPGHDPARLLRLGTTLLRHGVQVRRVTRAGSVTGTDYLGGRAARRAVPEGALVVDLAQPNGRLARTLLAREIPLPRSFTEQELTRLARNVRRAEGEQEGYAFYDVTSWSLPLAQGVEALSMPGAAPLTTEPLPALSEAQAKAPAGWEGDFAFPLGGGVVGGRARSAYVWRPGTLGATRLVARLLDEGFQVVVAERELVAGDSAFPRGSWIARAGRNPATLHQRIDSLAREAGVTVHAAQTAFPATGPTGTGSESTRSLRAPRVAVAAGEGVSENSYGALWFSLERRLGQPFTALPAARIGTAALDDYDVLILPDGRYRGVLDEAGARRLRGWVERGGTLIGYAGGAAFAQRQELGVRYQPVDSTGLAADSAAALARAVEERAPQGTALPPSASPERRPDAPVEVPGAFLRARLDPTHWLSFGYERAELPVLVQSLPLRASLGGANAVVYAGAGELAVSGFTWPDNTARNYAGGSYATVDSSGQGRVILLAEDPVYRATFDAPAQLLWNALYLGRR